MAESGDKATEYLACQGEQGACGFAVTQRTEFASKYKPAPQPTYEEVFELLTEGRADAAVVAVHNNRTGMVVEPLSLIAQNGVHVIDDVYQQVEHHVLVTKSLAQRFGVFRPDEELEPFEIQDRLDGAPEKQEAILSAISEVRSDDQGLRQCADFISRTMPNARRVTMTCTAAAAKSIKTETDELNVEVMNPPYSLKVAAIGSAYSARMFDLVRVGGAVRKTSIAPHPSTDADDEDERAERAGGDHGANTPATDARLVHGIQDYGGGNLTRYLLLSRKAQKPEDVDKAAARYIFLQIAKQTGQFNDTKDRATFKALSECAALRGREAAAKRDDLLKSDRYFFAGALIREFMTALKKEQADALKKTPRKDRRKLRKSEKLKLPDLEAIVRLLDQRSYRGGFWGGAPFEWFPFFRDPAPYTDPPSERHAMMEEAKTSVRAAMDHLFAVDEETGLRRLLSPYRSFIVLTPPKGETSIYPLLSKLLGATDVDATMVQVLPPRNRGEGERAFIELRAYLARHQKNGLDGDTAVTNALKDIAVDAHTLSSAPVPHAGGRSSKRQSKKGTFQFKGCIMARIPAVQQPKTGGPAPQNKTRAAQSTGPRLSVGVSSSSSV